MSLEFSDLQYEYIRNSNKRWNLKIGAVRSGKSYLDIAFVIPYYLRQLKEKAGLNVILGVSKETIERNVLQPMREIYTNAIVGTINNRNIAYVCGVPCYCLGAAKVNQVAILQGSSIKYCYGDEIAKWNKEVFTMLQSRLDKPYSRFDGSCNPESPGHWLKEFIDRDDINKYVQKYTIFDNPYLSKQFVKDLCTEYEGTVYYDRYINGNWTLAEGLIYPMYKEAVQEQPEEEPEQYCMSIDYGTMNAFAACMWARYGDIWYMIDEYYYSGRDTGEQKTDAEYADDLEIFTESVRQKMNRNNGYYEPLETIIDPSAASFIAELRRRGLYRVKQADNNVSDGIRNTAKALKTGLIKVSPKCKNWIREVQGYIWDESKDEDKPVKEGDHLQDAVRYFVQTKRIFRKPEQYTSLFNREVYT